MNNLQISFFVFNIDQVQLTVLLLDGHNHINLIEDNVFKIM